MSGFDTFAHLPALTLNNCGLTTLEGLPNLQHLRSLELDDNEPGDKLLAAVSKLEHLTDLSLCGCRLSGAAVARLLCSLSATPSFARPHAEVWAPLEVTPAQGARLSLMRNGISDADLGLSGPSALHGVVELALSGNPLVADAGLASLARSFPALRRLFLGRTGVVGDGCADILDRHWPMLEALALNGTPMGTDGFDKLHRALQARAHAVQAKQLLPPPLSAAAGSTSSLHAAAAQPVAEDRFAHKYFHLDVREIATLSPVSLMLLGEKMREYSREHANMPWVRRQYFGGGRHRHEGLVLRHDFEGVLTLRLAIGVVGSATRGVFVSATDGGGGMGEAGPFYVELEDVPQRTSVAEIVGAVVQAANTKAADIGRGQHQQLATFDEQRAAKARVAEGTTTQEIGVRAAFQRDDFPFAISDGRGRTWQETHLEGSGGRALPCGSSGRAAIGRMAVGSLLPRRKTATASSNDRRFDAVLGPPKQLIEARRIVELKLELTLRLPSPLYQAAAAVPVEGARRTASSSAPGRKRKLRG